TTVNTSYVQSLSKYRILSSSTLSFGFSNISLSYETTVSADKMTSSLLRRGVTLLLSSANCFTLVIGSLIVNLDSSTSGFRIEKGMFTCFKSACLLGEDEARIRWFGIWVPPACDI